MNKTFLALDLGTTTGWAQLGQDGIKKGTWIVKLSRRENPGMRFVKWEQRLQEHFDESPFERVAFEEVMAHKGVKAAHVYGGFLAILSAWCERHHISYTGVPVGTIKKFATGKGNATKDEMIAAAKAQGVNVADHNEADAVGLLFYVQKHLI